MSHSTIEVALSLLVAAAVLSSCTGADRDESKGNRHAESEMQPVAVAAKLGESGYGWRYFTNEHEGRAVVISPSGHYYYSDGEGLKLVFTASEAA
jgi:hypothetical protein